MEAGPPSEQIQDLAAEQPPSLSDDPEVFVFNGEPIHPSDPLYPLLTCAKFCENCHTSETSYWRTDDEGRDHCNPCGLHWTKHHTPRPIDPAIEVTTGKLANFACQICPTRKHARRRDEYRGVILCNACTDYWKRNNAVRPLIAFAKRPKSDHVKQPGLTIRPIKKCANCGTGRSTRWMVGPDGEDNCSECGLFWMYHKMRRPLGVGVGMDVIGPKRETRGPKIMDSRKRRLGSVNTGSGSESDGDPDDYEAMMEDEETKSNSKKTGQSEMDIDPEPFDNTPVSLLDLAVLVRKIQRNSIFLLISLLVHLQELSCLNSTLLCRPAISALLDVVDPLAHELSHMSNKDLTTFARGALSKSVIQNLLAHVVAAEAQSATSEDERVDVVTEDIDYGPDRVGDNFCPTLLSSNDAIDAAKGLIDLHIPDSDECDILCLSSLTVAGSLNRDTEPILVNGSSYPGFAECRKKIIQCLQEFKPGKGVADEQSMAAVNSSPDPGKFVNLFAIDTIPTICIEYPVPYSAKPKISTLASESQFPVHFYEETLRIKPITFDDPAIPIYEQRLPEILNFLQHYNPVQSFYVCLYQSNQGPVIVIGCDLDPATRMKLRYYYQSIFPVYFTESPEFFGPPRSANLRQGAYGKVQSRLEPGCSIGSPATDCAHGTFGCVLTDGNIDVGLTACHVVWSEQDYNELLLRGSLFVQHPIPSIHPSNLDWLIEKTSMDEELGRLKKEREKGPSTAEFCDYEVARIEAEKKNYQSRLVGTSFLRFLSWSILSGNGAEMTQCKLDFSLLQLHGEYSNVIAGPSSDAVQSPSGNFANIGAGMKVRKVGRSTGFTEGRVNGVRATVFTKGWDRGMTLEWTVVGGNGLPFASQGDDGSAVWDDERNLVGMIWGSNFKEGVAFVTPIHEILNSVWNLTGQTFGVKTCQENDKSTLTRNWRRKEVTMIPQNIPGRSDHTDVHF